MVVCDASFIGLAKVLGRARFGRPGGRLMALIKPQFEAGRAESARAGSSAIPGAQARLR